MLLLRGCDGGGFQVLHMGASQQSFLGTAGYLAPEIRQDRSYCKGVDVWALGILTYLVLTCRLPFDREVTSLPKKGVASQFQLHFSEPAWANLDHTVSSGATRQVKALLKGMLAIEPAERWNAAECLRHPFFTGELFGAVFEPSSPSTPSSSSGGVAEGSLATGHLGNDYGSTNDGSSSSSSGSGSSGNGLQSGSQTLRRNRSSGGNGDYATTSMLGRCISTPHLVHLHETPPSPEPSTPPPADKSPLRNSNGAENSAATSANNERRDRRRTSSSSCSSSSSRNDSQSREAAGTQVGWQSPGQQEAYLATTLSPNGGGVPPSFSDSESESSDGEGGAHEVKKGSLLSKDASPLRRGLPKQAHELSKTF